MKKIKNLLIFVFVISFALSPILGNVKKVSAAPAPGFIAQPYYVNYNGANYKQNPNNISQGPSFFIGDNDLFGATFVTKKDTNLSILDGSKDLYLALLNITYNSNPLAKMTIFTDNTEEKINAKILLALADPSIPEGVDETLDFYSSKPIWIHRGAGYDYTYDASALPEDATIATSGYISSDLQINYDGVDYNFNLASLDSSDEGTSVLVNSESTLNDIIFLFKDENPTNIIFGVDDTKDFDLILGEEIPDKGIGHTLWLIPAGFNLESLNGALTGFTVCRESHVFIKNIGDEDYTFKPLDTWTGCDKTKVILGNTNPTFTFETFPLTLTTTAPVPTLTTDVATNITKTSATLNGNITDIGFEKPTVRGFKYGKDTSYEEHTTDVENAPFGTGEFSTEISSLECGTLYHYQSYADNSLDTGYGEDKTFTTNDCARHTSSGSYMPGYGPRATVVPTIAPLQPTIPTTLEIKFLFTKNLKFGIIDNDVKELQKFLNTHGYQVSTTGAGSLGNETTKFGLLTQKALIKFQLANKITPAVGYFGPITRALVNSLNK